MIKGCLRQHCRSIPAAKRSPVPQQLTTVASAVRQLRPDPFSSHKNERRHEDTNLRRVFDSRDFWHDFNRPSDYGLWPLKGLLQNRYLTNPTGFSSYAQDIRGKCEKIVEDVLQASSLEQYKALPRLLDWLSDCLCRVLDVADFVRATHPDVQFQLCASQAYEYLWEYMNILNTTPGLKSQLQKALSNPEVSSSWSEEERTVAHILLKDFSNSAIDLPAKHRLRFVNLSNDMKRLGSRFLNEMAPSTSRLQISKDDLEGMDPIFLREHASSSGKVELALGGDAAYTAMASVHNPDVRRAIYMATKTVPRANLGALEQLLRIRVEIANLSSFSSYAEMNLVDKMAQSPAAVDSFLKALCADNAPYVAKELEQMRMVTAFDERKLEIQPWDVLFFQRQLNANFRGKTRKADFLSAYFSLGTVMQGLSRLFDRLYGIRFVPRGTGPGETWDPNVRRLDVLQEGEGHVAVLYCDLFQREGKAPNPAHFTLRCSRRITQSEISDTSLASNDGMARAVSPSTGQLCQLPTIALICDFAHPPNNRTPTLLSFGDVQTLFHEMGHAIHSILGRTSLQVVSGTRCPTDFAELPSVLMESFASDKSVLGLFARHWETDAALPYEMVQEVLDVQKRGEGMHTETQILYSLLDQAYHSSLPLERGFDSTATFYDIYDKYGSLREPRGVSPQGFFGHLVEYGGTYYSYLFDRAIAGKVWRQVFSNGQDGGGVNREAGEKLKDEVLSWGGGRSAWACVSGVLGDERLKGGGKEAMEEVGRWGVHY